MTADITISGLSIKIVAAYGPTEARSDGLKAQFWRDLHKAIKVDKRQQLLLMGDLNSTTTLTSRPQPTHFHGQTVFDESHNNNGERLVDFIYQTQLTLLNTCFRHKPKHKYTWYSADRKTRKTLDYVITADFMKSFCLDVRVRNGYDFFGSDHRLQVARFRTPKTKIGRKIHRAKKKSKKIDSKALNSELIDQYCQDLER